VIDAYLRWYLIAGVLLLAIAVLGTRVARWPMSTAMIYLAIGGALGAVGWIDVNFLAHARWLEIASEIAVILSLFSAGLRLQLPLRWSSWRAPLLLATVGMAVTVALVAFAGVTFLGLSIGAAVILGAVVAPTDPVLASDVQVADSDDRDPVRLALTGEAGLNDGMAFPFLLLGMGLLGMHDLGALPWRWLAVDVGWKVLGGLAVGAAVSFLAVRLIVYLRQERKETVGFDDFLALGLIACSYGLAHVIHAYGFVAVFAAGLTLRAMQRQQGGSSVGHAAAMAALPEEEVASDPEHATAYMAEAVLRFNSQMDRIAELALVILVGALIATHTVELGALMFAALLIFVIRPLAVAPCCLAGGLDRTQVALVSWFGVRGIGSIYYLAYAITHGVPDEVTAPLVTVTLAVIVMSTMIHGVTSTPVMRLYARRRGLT
jgi:NhaP-type Na+/H+ or K+/H+ antiporter